MSNVRVITDSSAELSADTIEALEITVVPWQIQMDGETLIDSPTLRTPEFFRRKSRAPLFAAPPTARQFADVFDRCARTTDETVVVLPSSRITLSAQRARQARTEFIGRCDVQIVDSQFVSCPLGALVIEAARAARAQLSATEIVRHVNGLIARTYFAFFTDAPDRLLQNGLVQNTPAMLGSPSGYKPLLLLEQGEISPLQRSRRRGDPIERMIEFVSEFGMLEHLWTVSTGLHPGLEQLKTRLAQDLPDKIFEDHIYGPVMASCFGSAILGVAAVEAPL